MTTIWGINSMELEVECQRLLVLGMRGDQLNEAGDELGAEAGLTGVRLLTQTANLRIYTS
jgi:hypothetical protein